MPCPLFEPRQRVPETRVPAPRLPLIYEFQGVCHGGEVDIRPEHRFKYCNQGNAKGNCAGFPAELAVSAVRFHVAARTPDELSVLVMEEQNYWPGVCNKVNFLIEDQRLEPEIADPCRRAQVFFFCTSYLEKMS